MEQEPHAHNVQSGERKENGMEEIRGALQEILKDVMRRYDEQIGREFIGEIFTLKEKGLLLTRLETPAHISVHFGMWKTDAKDRASALYENYHRLLNEFRQLAFEIKDGRAYRNVREIIAFSWLVTKHSNAFRHLGFHTEDINRHPLGNALQAEYKEALVHEDMQSHKDIPPSLAVITKEDFLTVYGLHRTGEEGRHNL